MRSEANAHEGSGETKGRHYETGEAVRIRWTNGVIDSVERTDEEASTLPWIGPGFVDLQLNGSMGIDLNKKLLSADEVIRLTRRLWEEGVTAYCPTIVTNSDEAITASVSTIRAAYEADPLVAASIAGIHLEGPFISPEDGARGAHGKQFVRSPDWDLFRKWQDASGGLIRILTLSPEWEGAADFISRVAETGVTVSIGHTAATPEQIREAVAAGATMSTHLGNGSHLMLPRHHNYIWEQLAADELWAGIIADGFHLPDAPLRVFLRAKGDKAVLVSDAVYLCGLEPGQYKTHIGGNVVLTPEGRLHLADNPALLAGSAQFLAFGIRHLVRDGICTLPEAWNMASVRPSRVFGLPTADGLRAGAPADLLLCDYNEDGLAVRRVYKEGRVAADTSGSDSSSQA